jgi:hypothetical protein
MKKTTTKTTTQLHDECLSHCATLGIPLEPGALDEVLSRAEKENQSHLQFLDLFLGRRPMPAASAASRAGFGKPALQRIKRWKALIGSSIQKLSTVCRSRNWQQAILSGAGPT